MADRRPLTTAAQNFFSQFNAAQDRRRNIEFQEQRRQDIINAAELKRQQEVQDAETRTDLADQLFQGLPGVAETTFEDVDADAVETGAPGTERRGPGRVQDFTFSPKARQAAAGLVGMKGATIPQIVDFFTKASDFQTTRQQQIEVDNGNSLRFIQDQFKKGGRPAMLNGISAVLQNQQVGPVVAKELADMSNLTNPDAIGAKFDQLIFFNTNRKTLADEAVKMKTEARAEQVTIREEARGEEITRREEVRQEQRDIRALARTPIKPLSTIAKINADFAAGLITESQKSAGLAKATRAESLVNVQAFEREEAKLGARSDAAVRDEVKDNARAASRDIGKVRNLSSALKKAKGGALTQILPDLGRVIPGLDALIGTGDEQAALAAINSFVLLQMQAFKGTTSNRELDFARTTVARLGNTREANEIIVRSFENVIFLAQQENKQFDEFLRGGGKGRNFIFNFQKVLFKDHPTFGTVTLDDIQTTAFENGITMEEAIKELRRR